jgi:putative methionine-R-sulfoxide reductase with GAF domain
MKLVGGERLGARLVETAQKNAFYSRERRRAVRNAVHTPAYASLNGSSQTVSLDLWEILNISECGSCIQAPGPMKVNRLLPLTLDLSATGDRIHTTGHVVWSESCGRSGIRFPDLPESSLLLLRRWLQTNDVAGGVAAAESDSDIENDGAGSAQQTVRARPGSAAGYSSLLAEWAEIEREVELFGPNLSAALQLIAERALALTWATGSAIALRSEITSPELICEARAGNDAPELGARLDTDSGFSGDCVRSGSTLICDDAQMDPRVDRENCRMLGIRSIIACPITVHKNRNIGLLEVFSPEATAFWDNDARTLERLARIIANAIIRAKQPVGKNPLTDESEAKQENKTQLRPDKPLESEVLTFGPSPRARLAILFACGIATVIFSVWLVAPWISEVMTKFTSPPSLQAAEVRPERADYVGMTVADLEKIALHNDSAAQYSLGMKYASGDGTAKDYHAALGWFLKAADNGNPRAAVKIASCFWAGKGTQQDFGRAYFWGLLAQAAGDETGRVIVINSAPHLTDHHRSAEQQEADSWLRSHHMGSSAARASR